ncbi:MAG: LamG domain-containing protein [Proteobacteria bacterium]|nr:LamG domain-containing protein [Pseudomonadota bacterium]
MKRIRTGGSTIQAFCWLIILWVSVLGLSINAYAGLRDGLIAYYPFDGGPMDAGPDGYHGIEYNGVSLSADRVGNPDSAYSFDGHDDYISAGNFNLPLVFSVSMWVNPHDTADGRMFFGKPSASGNPLIAVGFSNGGYSVVIGTVSYSEGIKTTGWQHLAVVVEKNGTQYSRVLFYKNGQLLWSKNNFYQVKDTGLNLISMGSAWSGMSPANFFSGQMDDVRLYDRALAQTEIELLYNPVTGLDVKADDDIDGEDLRIFAKNVGQTRWYKDQDKDGYSDGTTRWSQSRPDEDYYSAAELNGVSGDCDDLNPGINPAATGAECPPFGGCCYTADENCIPVTRCEDNVSERICINELNGTFHENRQCAGLSSEECPVGAEPQGACCVSQGDSGLSDRCIEARTKPQCMDIGGKWYQDQLCADLTENECPSTGTETGACCRPKISYVNESGVFPVQCLDSLTEYKCQLLQGSWFRARTCDSLSQEECPPIPPVTGACCRTMLSGDGSTSYAVCDSMTGDECAAVDGSFFADRQCSELSSEECPIQAATGACCHPKISYVNESGVFPVQCLDKLTEYKCKILQGSWYQDQKCADLDGSVCAPYGACCYEDAEGIKKCANWMLESSCSKLSGTFHANQTCAEVECVPPPAVGACCLTSTGADGSTVPVRCVDARTQTQCTAIGGSWYEEKNCSQLSYEECPPIPEAIGACCSTMTSGDGSTTAVCNNNVTISQCSDIGGSFFADRQCSELSSAECPVPVPTGACCHPKISYVNESGVFPVQCLDKLTEYKCKILQGSWYQDQKCADLDGSVCPPYGACCYTDAQGIDKCANWMLESACTKLSGEFKANQTCAEAQCVPPAATGACCLSNISTAVRCVDARTQTQCTAMGGSWYEEQNCSQLSYEECPPIQEIQGACCQTMMSGDGTTTAVCNDDVTTSACADAGGSFYADRQCSDLSSAECPVPVPTGACCHPKISYVNESGVFPVQCLDKLTEYKCKLLQGSWYQEQTCEEIDGSVCPPYGACCYKDAEGIIKCANWMLESNCKKLGGKFSSNRQCSDLSSAECQVTPIALGACCLSTISTDPSVVPVRCVDARSQAQCKSMGGSWFDGENCEMLGRRCPALDPVIK